MALWDTPFNEIDALRLQALVDQDVIEGTQLEYKELLDISTADGKRDFVRAITSFANSAGGDLVIGVQTKDGHPSGIVSVTSRPDFEKQRFENVARDNIEPRLHGMNLNAVAVPDGGYVLVARVAQSLDPPHRVTINGMNKFYGRNSAGRYELSLEELRRLFTYGPRLSDRVREFRASRLMRIAADETPVQLARGMRTVIHIIPLRLFAQGRNRALIAAADQNWTMFVPPGRWDGSSHQFNLDGMFTHPRHGPRIGAYGQVFAAGAVESVLVDESEERQPPGYFLANGEMDVATIVAHYGGALRECGVSGPLAVFVSLIGTKGMRTAESERPGSQRSIDRDQIHCDEVVLQEIPEAAKMCAPALRDIFDQLANAAGFNPSPNFNPDGTWRLKGRQY